MSFTDEAGDRALQEAIQSIEKVSAVEVVVAVRAYARRWMVAHMIVGLMAAIAVLVYAVVFELPPWAGIAFPIATGVVSTLIVELVPPLYRFLVPPYVREHHVIQAARSLFVERRVHSTRDRTGMLVFIAVRARTAEIVGDLGVIAKVGQDKLDDYAAKLKAAIPRGAEALAKELASFAPELAIALPRRADDVNELPDAAVQVGPEG
jgi:putative membrane protein